MRRHSLLGMLGLLAACAGPAYVLADALDRNRCETCTGTIVALEDLSGGGFVLRVTPRPADAHLLAQGQAGIACTIPEDWRHRFTDILPMLKVGGPVEVSGYWVMATATGHNELRPVTSVDPIPDGR